MITTRPEIRGSFGMVSSTHWLASATGMSVLERGGNAFDAAVAAGLVLQVVEPHLNGPAGEVPIIYHDGQETRVLNGQGAAPAAATPEHFQGLGLDLVPGTGLLPACVPGAFDAWMSLLLRHGTLPLREVMSYAIGYARDGYPVVPRFTSTVASVAQLFEEEWTDSAQLYLPGGRPPEPYSRFRNPELAATYERVLTEAEAATGDRDGQVQAARDVWYRGFVAETIGHYAEGSEVMDSSGRRHTGLLTAQDLAGHDTPDEAPASRGYHDWTVHKTGPWGQGPVFLQQLAMLEGVDLTAMGHLSADYVHTVVEAAKLAFADREAWYGDPAHVDVPLAELLSDGYATERRLLLGETASHELRPGSPGGRAPLLPGLAFAATGAAPAGGVGEPTVGRLSEDGPEHVDGPLEGDTCHVDVVDRHGNMVAATPSGGWLQSSPVIPGLGFGLGTRGQMFWLEQGLPNSLAPGKRPRTTLSPGLALREDGASLAFGTPGGDTQDQWALAFFLAHVHFGLDLQAAIDAPMFHTTHFPSSFYPRAATPGQIVVEGRLRPAVVEELGRRGHEVIVGEDWSLGRLCAVSRQTDGFLAAGADPRSMQGYAVGR